MGTATQRTRQSGYDILKLVLALQVVFSHSWELLGVSSPVLLNRSPGNVAVHAFFVLSGYFITMSCEHAKSIGDYTWKRLIRLLPAYTVAMAFSTIMGNACNHFAELPTSYIINGCVWTLYYEIVLYACVALLRLLKLLNKETIGAVGCVISLTGMVHAQDTEVIYSIILPMIFMFVFGSYIYLAHLESEMSRLGPWALLGLAIIQFFPALFDAIGKAIPLIYGPDLSVSLMLCVYMVSLPTAVLWFGRFIRVAMPRFPDLSYGVYLFGWPVQQAIIYWFLQRNSDLSPVRLFFFSTIATLLIACVSWYCLEVHALKTKNWYVRAVSLIKGHLPSKNRPTDPDA